VAKFRYLGTAITNQNLIQEEIKRRLNSGNACYHSVQNLLRSQLLSKNLKIRIYKTIILPVVLYRCKTWSLTLREEHRLRVFENRVLRRIFGSKRDHMTGDWRKRTVLSLLISCKLSFPIIGLKMSFLPTLALKSPSKIFIWYLGNLSNTCSSSS
jgi:hypothetical protein